MERMPSFLQNEPIFIVRTTGHPGNDFSIRRALEEAGVEFLDANGSGSGVRLRENSS
jgi:hypothetical protein